MLFTAAQVGRYTKNCDPSMENGRRPRPKFFPIRTSRPVNNIYILQNSKPTKFCQQNHMNTRLSEQNNYANKKKQKKELKTTAKSHSPTTHVVIQVFFPVLRPTRLSRGWIVREMVRKKMFPLTSEMGNEMMLSYDVSITS